MTQWLIEEAAFIALEIDEARLQREASEEHQAEALLLERHAELTQRADAIRGGVA